MTRKDRTEGIYSRREVLDESERRQYYQIQIKDLLSYAYRYSEDVKKRFDRAQFQASKFKTLTDSSFASEQYGIAVKKGNAELLAIINKGVAGIKADGTYNQIYTQYFGSAPAAAPAPAAAASK